MYPGVVTINTIHNWLSLKKWLIFLIRFTLEKQSHWIINCWRSSSKHQRFSKNTQHIMFSCTNTSSKLKSILRNFGSSKKSNQKIVQPFAKVYWPGMKSPCDRQLNMGSSSVCHVLKGHGHNIWMTKTKSSVYKLMSEWFQQQRLDSSQ